MIEPSQITLEDQDFIVQDAVQFVNDDGKTIGKAHLKIDFSECPDDLRWVAVNILAKNSVVNVPERAGSVKKQAWWRFW